jgi:hypothetical protein
MENGLGRAAQLRLRNSRKTEQQKDSPATAHYNQCVVAALLPI